MKKFKFLFLLLLINGIVFSRVLADTEALTQEDNNSLIEHEIINDEEVQHINRLEKEEETDTDIQALNKFTEEEVHKCSRDIDITIVPDKAENYLVNETAAFNIEMKRHNNLADIKLEQIEATFPDEVIPVTPTKLSKGKFNYTTEKFIQEGNKTLFITVRTSGTAESIQKLELLIEKIRNKIVSLEALKAGTTDERKKQHIDKLIAVSQKIIQKTEARIEMIWERSIIGEASCTISVVNPKPNTPQLTDPGSISVDGRYTITWSDEIASGAAIYEIQEDTTNTFISPAIYWSTTNSQNIVHGEDGTYYYRVMAWTARPEAGGISSDWSNTVDITVAIPVPPPPEGADAGYIHGTVYDGSTDVPLLGVKITVEGVSGAVITDQEGNFTFPIIGYPVENKKTVIVVIEKSGYTYVQRRVTVTTTRDTSVDPAYLIPLDSKNTIITSAGGTATNFTGSIEMVFPADAVTNNIEVNATDYKQGKELPGPLPGSSFFTYAIDLRPDGTIFNQPVTVRIANTRGFAAGTPIPVGYYNKDTVRWEHESMGEVTSDGQWVEFIVNHFSPRDINLTAVFPSGANRPKPNKISDDNNEDQTKDEKDPGVSIRSGTLLLEHALPTIKRLGKSEGLKFTYLSSSACPSAFIGIETESLQLAPKTSGWIMDIEGLHIEKKFAGTEDKTRQAYIFPAKNGRGQSLQTGSYPYSLKTSNDYKAEFFTVASFGGPPVQFTGVFTNEPQALMSNVEGRVIINNEMASPFGSGWTLNGLQKLHFNPDGRVLLTEGNGSSLMFTPGGHIPSTPYVDGFSNPGLLTVDEGNNLYVPSVSGIISSYTIYKITPDVTRSIYAEISCVALVFDPMGNLYASGDDGNIYKVTPGGNIETFFTGFSSAVGLAFDKDNNLYVADTDVIYKITSQGKEVFASGLNYPSGLAFDDQGNLYVANSGDGTVLKISPDGTKAIYAGGFTNPYGITFDAEGNLFVTDVWTIYRVNTEGEKEIFVSGFHSLKGIVIDKLGNLYVSDGLLGAIYKMTLTENKSALFISPAGEFSKLTYNTINGIYTRTLKDGTKINFNSEGLQTATIDRSGNTTSYNYGDVNNDGKAEELINIIEPMGDITNFTYQNGYLYEITDPAGRTSQFNIDSSGNLVAITTPDGANTQYVYDGNHLINEVIDPLARTTQYTHSPDGKYGQIVFPTGGLIKFIPSKTQGLINDIPEGTGTAGNPAPFIAAKMPDLLTDGKGFTTTYETNKSGAVTKKTDPLGKITVILRDINSNPVKITRPNGSIVDMSYDVKGNLLSVTEESINAITLFTYEPNFNKIKSITDPKGNITSVNYDAKGNPIKITDALGNMTTMIYDTKGLLTSITNAKGNITTFAYDEKGNLIQTIDPLTHTTNLVYDDAGNVISSTDAEGKTTLLSYDLMNRLISVTDANNKTTHYAYDLNGNSISVIDANGNTTTSQYNRVNQLVYAENPLGESKTYSYDQNRNLTEFIDAKGQTINFVYDSTDKLVQKILPDDMVNYTYDNNGNLMSVTDNDSQVSFNYDLANRLVSTTQNGITLTYTYDKNGNRLTMADPTGTTNYAYNARNQMTQVTNPNTQITNFTYDALGRRVSTGLPNGITTNYSYDIADQLTNIQSEVTNYGYTYDRLGNRTSMTDLAGVHNYTYDIINRLTGAIHPQVSNPAENFGYDPVGNRTSSHISNNYVYNSVNRLLEDDQFNYTYDANGNLIQKQSKANAEVTIYTYDAENKLIQVINPQSQITRYKYDGLGRRIEKNVNGSITRYVYDKENILLEYDGANNLMARYTHGLGIDEPLIMERGGQSYYYHADGLGSITMLTDSGKNVVQTYVYSSFGQIVEQIGSLPNPYAYTSREYDSESGLYFYRARYYDPKIGRFLQEDPIGFIGGVNLYAYVGNNPLKFSDPFGLCKESDENWDKEFNLFDPNSALYRQFISIGKGLGGELALIMGDQATAIEAFRDAASDSGQAILDEANAPDWAYTAYYSALATSAVAGITAATLIGIEAAADIRVEVHGTHGGRVTPHIQGIQGPGWGETLWRFPPH